MLRSLALILAIAACGSPEGELAPPASPAIRLTDAFQPDAVVGRVAQPEVARSEWRFDATPPAFEAGPEVAELALRDGRLAGRTTGRGALLRIDLPSPPPTQPDA